MNPALMHSHAQDRYEELLREAQRERSVRSRLAARQALLDRVRAERALRSVAGQRPVVRGALGTVATAGVRVALARWVVRRLAPELLP